MPAKIIELVDQQMYLGQAVENVFHYVNPDGVAEASVLLTDYVTDVLPLVRALQNTQCSHTNIRWRQVFPTTTLMLDYASGLPVVGTDAGDPLPTHEAASFKWLLSNPTTVLSGGFTGHIRRGGCRLAGIGDTNESGNAMGAGYIAAAATWFNELKDPGTDAFLLCVASFLIGNHVPLGPPRARSETVTAYTIVGGATAPAPSTQNTRKFLRGIAS